MTKTIRSCFVAILAMAFITTGCSKKDNSPTESQSTPPPLPSLVFKGPSSNSSSPGLTVLQSYVSTANELALSLVPFAFTTPVFANGVWTWTVVNKTLTMALTAASQTDGTYAWKLYFDGTDPSDSTKYSHWLAVDGSTSADGKTGSGKSYAANTTTVSTEFGWTTTNNVLTGTLKPYLSGIAAGQTVIVNNPDNSGELSAYMGTVLVYKGVWQPNGSGQWWTYDANGQQTGTGSWT